MSLTDISNFILEVRCCKNKNCTKLFRVWIKSPQVICSIYCWEYTNNQLWHKRKSIFVSEVNRKDSELSEKALNSRNKTNQKLKEQRDNL